MTWDDIEKVLFDGNKEDISKLRCLNCDNPISYSYNKDINQLTVKCPMCGYTSISHSCEKVPNCAWV